MAVKFVIGRAGSGKTRYCIDEIREHLIREPEGAPLILLVPQQFTFEAERELVSKEGVSGTIRAQVLSFHRLAWRIMQAEGGTARTPIDEIGKKLLLRRIMQRRQGQLKFYAGTQDQQGVIDRMDELFTEWKRYGMQPQHLEERMDKGRYHWEHSQSLEPKMQDLMMVYREFEEELKAQYLDGEDVLTLLAEQIIQSEWLSNAKIWIDGFHGFTPQEMAVIERLMIRCPEVSMTFCLDRPYYDYDDLDDLALFHPTARTMRQLQRSLVNYGLPAPHMVELADRKLPTRFTNNPMLGFLEQYYDRNTGRVRFDKKDAEKVHGNGRVNESIVIAEAASRRAEVEGVCREMVRLTREEEVRWRDMAVMVRNMNEYGELLSAVMSDFNIPHFLDQKRSVLHHPLVEFIRSALEVVNHQWHYDAVFRCVKTDFLLPWGHMYSESRLRRQMDRLENYVLAFGIKGSRWSEEKAWTYRERRSLEGPEEELREAEEKALAEINETRRWVSVPLHHFARRLKDRSKVQGKVEALFELLAFANVPERLERWSLTCSEAGQLEEAREHTQLWDRVMDVFDQLVDMLGEEEVSNELFADLVETGLESISMGLVPPSLDEVLVGTVDRTRSGSVTHAFILGVNEGVLPARLSEDGLLTENEREMLQQADISMADSAKRKLLDEQFLIYNAITSASSYLWMSYPLADEEGKGLLPSEIMKRIRYLFPQVKVKQLALEPTPFMSEKELFSYLAHPQQAFSFLGVQLKRRMQGEDIAKTWWDVYNWLLGNEAWNGKLERMVQALMFDNHVDRLPASTSRELYGSHLKASVSRMERFAGCPFSHFASHGLRLRERKVYALEAPDIGQLYHAALSEFAQGLQRDGLDWGDLSPEDCYKRSAQVVEELAPKLPGDILLSSHRFRHITRKLQDVVGRSSVVLAEHAKRGEFKPLATELDFGPGSTLPALEFTLENGCTMEIIGRIDRVDQADTEGGVLLRVIDYKSSATALDMAEVFHGLSLQMLTYLDVVITHAEKWLGIEAKPAGVLYFHVHNPLLLHANRIGADKAEEETRKRYKMKGLLAADTEIIGMMDSALKTGTGHSQLLPVAITKDGGFYKNSSVATDKQWKQIRSYVRGQIKQIGTDITDGAVDISPYRMGNKAACMRCSYRSVCQFEPHFAGSQYQVRRKMSGDELWSEIDRCVMNQEVGTGRQAEGGSGV
ncbi:helicase-exonuclease AddAB subunit AddB [Paenibacillus sp. N1-5-1-14]|uniref:helicase-exonuclease AddAB subunit AddB n=1 Tax=Paenibacillus radicibacter TaxID=2972488 RepID=UPI002158B390|nr:helicase-exonuclease AddAB subunit AddB [Paenibacillus radicibacter]MCR8645679.1 helicase-exonuclease AddAB subunit AddB [Paenibacillus radicibacter]